MTLISFNSFFTAIEMHWSLFRMQLRLYVFIFFYFCNFYLVFLNVATYSSCVCVCVTEMVLHPQRANSFFNQRRGNNYHGYRWGYTPTPTHTNTFRTRTHVPYTHTRTHRLEHYDCIWLQTWDFPFSPCCSVRRLQLSVSLRSVRITTTVECWLFATAPRWPIMRTSVVARATTKASVTEQACMLWGSQTTPWNLPLHLYHLYNQN